MAPLGKLTGSVRTQRGQVVVAVSGDVDLATAPQFRALLDAALAFGTPVVRLDMTDVGFIDGQALEILARAAARMNLMGGKLVVTSPSPQSYRVFQMTQLVRVLGVQAPGDAAELTPSGIEVLAMGPNVRDLLNVSLMLVVTMAATIVEGADGVSITLPRKGEFVTVAASDDVVLGMDHDQYDTEQGPCLDAARQGLQFFATSLKDELRWPDFVPKARARGIESILSTPLAADGRVLGALNVYSRQPGGVAEREMPWVEQLARSTMSVLTQAEESQGEQSLLDDLQSRLASRDMIAVAQGVLMQRQGMSQSAAHAALIATSRRTDQPLVDVCADVVSSTVKPEGRPDPTL